MLTIYLNNKPYRVSGDGNLLNTCLSLGFDIPYFCWHPALHSVGSCRLCAVKSFKDENDTRGNIIMACTTPLHDGMRISTDDPEVLEFRASILELMMINHPHDCPVCDEGGECHLQDMTVMTGHNYRRYRFTKRTFRNQRLGPFIHHEMNRCIHCYRCVRYYRDYAGGRDFDILGTHDHVYFGRYEDGKLENEFSGNLAEVCPTGVFTDATLKRHFTRKWDLMSAPSICVHCGMGCNTIAGERYGTIRCIRNRYNGDVNGYFLCDRGRFGYGFLNTDRRVRNAYVRDADTDSLKPVDTGEAIQRIARILHFGANVAGIGSPRASLEANFALRQLVGEDHFYAGFSAVEQRLTGEAIDILDKSHVNIPTIAQAENADAVFILGEDVTNTAPRLALALRQTVIQQPYRKAAEIGIPFWVDTAKRVFIQEEKGPFFVAAPYPTHLDDLATDTLYAPPDDLARLGFAVAHEIDPSFPAVQGLPGQDGSQAARIAAALSQAERPLVVSGTGALSTEVMRAAQCVALALKKTGREASLFLAVPECNSLGLGLMTRYGLDDALEKAGTGGMDAVIVLENDLSRRLGKEVFETFCRSFRQVIVVDHIMTDTSQRAAIVLPAASFAEADGTLVNSEGRAQKSFRAFVPEDGIRESWKWISDIMSASGHPRTSELTNPDEIIRSLSRHLAAFTGAETAAPAGGFRMQGMKIPRQPHRYSGRTAISADVNVHEPQTVRDPDSALSFTMEGYEPVPPPPLVPRFWAPGWNSVQAVEKYKSVAGDPLAGGNAGVRILERAHGGRIAHEGVVPDAFQARKGHFFVVPIYHLFGSEEMSSLCPEIADLSPEPYLALNPEDSVSAGISNEGELAELVFEDGTLALPVKALPALNRGVAGLPSGVRGVEWVRLPLWAQVRKA